MTILVNMVLMTMGTTLRTFSPCFGHPNEQIGEQIKMHVPLRSPLAPLRAVVRRHEATRQYVEIGKIW